MTADIDPADHTMDDQHMTLGETELRALCARLLSGGGETADTEQLLDDEPLRRAVCARLEACGVQLILRDGQPPLCAIPQPDELAELPLACLALCALTLTEQSGGRRRARLPVRALWERLGKPRGYSERYLRATGLGPLEQRGLIRVVRPQQRASEAYIVAGPALGAVDTDALRTRLRTLREAA